MENYVFTTESAFALMPLTLFELKELIKHVNTYMLSCIEGINAKPYKTIWERIWEKGPIGNFFTSSIPEKLPFKTLQTILKYS